MVYLLTGYQDQHFEFRQSLCDYIADEKKHKCLQFYIPLEYKSGMDYTEKNEIAKKYMGE